MSRPVLHTYRDPLDLIWLETARRLGMPVVRDPDVFASWRPGALHLATSDALDSDDCLAQMILHETCHALIEGPDGMAKADWGLENIDERDLDREYACQRLQAALTDPWGLRALLAVTTEHRGYYDALGEHPLQGEGPSVLLARQGWKRATEGEWSDPLRQALAATRTLALATEAFADQDSLWSLRDTDRSAPCNPQS